MAALQNSGLTLGW